MGRIIPWDLPKINGGSVGGYTPEPTPEPPAPEITGPYDFTDFAIVTNISNTSKVQLFLSSGSYVVGATFKAKVSEKLGTSLSVSGVKIVDTSNVAQIIAHCKIPAIAIEIDATSSLINYVEIVDMIFDLDITPVMTTTGGSISPESASIHVANCIKNIGSGVKYCYVNTTSSAMSVLSIDAYNSNGVSLQTWTPPEEEPEEVEE